MDCGASDLLCRTFVWLREVGIDLAQWDAWLWQTWPNVADAIQKAIAFLARHSEKIFGLAGFSFGVWRWWYYRESVLHKRLQEYLAEQEERLHQARSYVLDAILRPGPKRRFAEPLFAVRPLRTLLRRRGWRLLFGVGRVEVGANRLLRKALRKIDAQLETAQATITNLYYQSASAHILKGAIASARAGNLKSMPRSAELDRIALNDFRSALQIPGRHQAETKEYEAHQLRRLGNLREAEDAYRELDAIATRTIPPGMERDLVRARARRWLASIAQAHAWDECRRGLRSSSGSKYANRLMTGQKNISNDADDTHRIDAAGALPLREPHGPFHNWDAVEQGDMHYLSAFIYHNLGFTRRERNQLNLAETSYRGLLDQTPTSRWLVGGSTRRLRLAALAGLDRVNDARTQSKYDSDWLLPSSQDSQQPATHVGNAGSS
jgi:tetratricopeptide (TPR) repeat protein